LAGGVKSDSNHWSIALSSRIDVDEFVELDDLGLNDLGTEELEWEECKLA